MTNAERRAILEGAQERTYAALAKADVWDAETVNHLLHNIAEFDYILNNARIMQKNEQPETESPGTEVSDPGQPETELTKEAVKAKLLELSNQCDALNLAAVMDGMGYAKLSDVPAAKYGELLQRAETAAKELS